MTVYTTENKHENIFDKIKLSDTAVALGSFDAMHKGHCEIIRRTIDYAKKNKLCSVVYMFRNHPASFVNGEEIKSINTFKKRLEIAKNLGTDLVIAQWFTQEFKNITPFDFFTRYLCNHLGARFVSAGFNYHFGKDGAGDTSALELFGNEYDVKICTVPCVRVNGCPISSSRIRKLISDGNMEEAADCLGRFFSVSGKVIHGNQIGRTIGFPTANVNLPKDNITPKSGVYITKTYVGDKSYPSITNVGTRPTVNCSNSLIETHLENFCGDIYGLEITVEFYSYLREIKKFPNLEQLKAQLNCDQNRLKSFFTKNNL